MVGYYGFTLDFRVSVRTYARYIGRLAFVLASGLFRHCGVKQIDKNSSCGVKEDQRKIKGITS